MKSLISLFIVASMALASAATDMSYERAFQLYNRTDYSGASAILRQAAPDARNLTLWGKAAFQCGDYRNAIEILERAVAADPNSSVAIDWLGRAYGRRAETAFALTALSMAGRTRDAFQKAVSLDPTNSEALNDLFEFYVDAPGLVGGGVDKAKELVPRIAKLDAAEGEFALARIAEHQKEYGAAESHFRKAIQHAPKELGRVLDLASFYARRGRFQDSEKIFSEASAIAPNSPRVLMAHASAYIDQKQNVDQAREWIKKYLASQELTPDDTPRWEAEKLLKKAGG